MAGKAGDAHKINTSVLTCTHRLGVARDDIAHRLCLYFHASPKHKDK
ncbi:hypothetical protein AF72_06550 [Xylella taiwanensis]|uniref:Uncharacterized protein n=1 Tax=Xylella taiwanensis TaxID=1444770 RepID=Z9JJK6_9GAMM|nr:hypothetical protein AF72_06550 [Xylella taiwanensis]